MAKIDDFLYSKDSNNKEFERPLSMAFRALALIAMLISLIGSLHPDVRQFLKSYTNISYRKVLSTVTGVFQQKPFKIVKIKNNEGLFIEVYQVLSDQDWPLISKFQLPDNRDGYIMFQDQATNLALQDIDGDLVPEIIAPSYDKNLTARLNVYKYNEKHQDFQLVSGPEFLDIE